MQAATERCSPHAREDKARHGSGVNCCFNAPDLVYPHTAWTRLGPLMTELMEQAMPLRSDVR